MSNFFYGNSFSCNLVPYISILFYRAGGPVRLNLHGTKLSLDSMKSPGALERWETLVQKNGAMIYHS